MSAVRLCSLLLLAAALPGQELLWESHPTTSRVVYCSVAKSFGDFDRDGCDDLLACAIVNYNVWGSQYHAVRILSGRDGVVLDEHPTGFRIGNLVGVGDFDLDGYPDYAYTWDTVRNGAWVVRLDVWSPRRRQVLLSLTGPPGAGWGWGFVIAGRLDFTGDGLPDLLVSGGNLAESILFAYDHSGAVAYTIPARRLGFIVLSAAAYGDLDGDGADDFLVGGSEVGGVQHGAVALVSGRTGAPLRLHWGPRPWDILGAVVTPAGDVDGDGVIDYAGGNSGFRGLVMVWSGRTGALIRQWTGPVGYLTGAIVAGRDVDLDGFPDVIDVAGGYPNVPGNGSLWGRVRTLSSRDGQDLVHVASQQWTAVFAQDYADLGVQPGNPYPVFAVVDVPVPPGTPWRRIRAWRLPPQGTAVVGAGCASAGAVPTVGVRRVETPAGERSRIVLGSAPPGALAWCLLAPAGAAAPPLPLDPYGFAGCTLLVPPALAAARLAGTAGMDRGYAAVDFPSALTATMGTAWAAQWLAFDPAGTAHAATARYRFRLQ